MSSSTTLLEADAVPNLAGGAQTGDQLWARRGSGTSAVFGMLPYPVIPTTITIGTVAGTAAGGDTVAALQTTVGTKVSHSGTVTPGHLAVFADTTGLVIADGGAVPSGSTGTSAPALPSAAALLNTNSVGTAEAVTLGANLSLSTANVLSAVIPALTPAQVEADLGYVPVNPTSLAPVATSGLPASAQLLGSTSAGAAQAIVLDANTLALTTSGGVTTLGVVEETPSQLTVATSLPSGAGSGFAASSNGTSFDILVPFSLLSSGGSGSTSSTSSGTITAGSTTATAGQSVSFTYTPGTSTTPYAGWVTAGSTTAGLTAPTLVGSAVALSSTGTAGSIAAPSAAGSYQLALLSGPAGTVLALSSAVTVSGSSTVPALTLSSGGTFGALAGIEMLTAGGAAFPASLLPTSGIFYVAVEFVIPATGGLNLIAVGNALLYTASNGSVQLYTVSDGAYTGSAGTYGDGKTHIATLVFGGGATVVYVDGTLVINHGVGLGAQTGSVYLGSAGTFNTATIPAGAGLANAAIVAKDPGVSPYTFPTPPYTGANTPGLVAAWSMNNTTAGNT